MKEQQHLGTEHFLEHLIELEGNSMARKNLTEKDQERIDYLKSELISKRNDGWNEEAFRKELIDDYGLSKKYVESL